MQNLDIISVNIWSIVISLLNLVLIFFILKFFLFRPVKAVIEKRKREVEEGYESAARKEASALALKAEYESRIDSAHGEAENIISDARISAGKQRDIIINDAKGRADMIVRNAEAEAEKHLRDSSEAIKKEIADVSVGIAEKLVAREINGIDRQKLVDDFISSIGDGDEA